MKKHRLRDLHDVTDGNVLSGIVPGRYLDRGSVFFFAPGQRAHDDEPRHVHEGEYEAFLLLQGAGHVELDDRNEPCRAGDVLVVEPGENHHLTSSQEDPMVTVWLITGDARHENQQG